VYGHTAAYWLMLTLREPVPKTHRLAHAEFATLRLRLLKLGVRVIETLSRIRLAFAAAFGRLHRLAVDDAGAGADCARRCGRPLL
jgi:hypothetical protein